METKIVFIGTKEDREINKKETPDFLLLYEQSVLLSLKARGILNDVQFQACMEELSKQFLRLL